MANDVTPIDHRALALSRLITQYRESTNLRDYLYGLLVESPNLEQVFQDLINKRSINTATGANLDNIGSIVGQLRQVGDQTLDDDDYRKFIKAKIVRNYTRATPEEIIASVIFILDVPQVQYADGGGFVTIGIGRELTAAEINLIQNLGIIPVPAAIDVNYFEYDSQEPFSYRSVVNPVGIPNARGYGSVFNPTVGGKYSTII